MLLGHKGRCFDVRISAQGSHVLSGSEDGTSRLWNLTSKTSIHTLIHDQTSEVLRAMFLSNPESSALHNLPEIVTCGSDGKAIVWSGPSGLKYEKKYELLHNNEQIYVCEYIPAFNQAQLLTAADDSIYLWDLAKPDMPFFDSSFEATSNHNIAFGGPRNPDNKAFIFDCKFSPIQVSSSIFAVALSDGTLS
jgi:WD40 repeat protein